tara:strand:+ start:999 stop:1544 length:546 start_codon:yes stop_codon:yes gene_type:complete
MLFRSTYITRLSEEFERQRATDGVRKVFALTSTNGSSLVGSEVENFFFHWAGWYMENFPEQTLLMWGPEKKIIGYLVGCLDSASAGELFKNIFYYKKFAHWYTEYPSHLHVNCHPKYQGGGHGEALVEKFGRDAQVAGTRGLHVVTGSGARNRTFYERLKFRECDQKLIDGRSLVLLGKYL